MEAARERVKLANVLTVWNVYQSGRRPAVLLHSSVLNYFREADGPQEWDELWDSLSRVQLLLASDTLAAWRLLQDSRCYGRRAKQMLRLIQSLPCDNVERSDWLFNDLYRLAVPREYRGEGGEPEITAGELFRGPILVVFGDLAAQEEFLTHVPPDPALYIQYNTRWKPQECCTCLCTLAEAQKHMAAEPLRCADRIRNPGPVEDEKKLLLVEPVKGDWKIRDEMMPNKLAPTGQEGGFCTIYRGQEKNRLYRVYKNRFSDGKIHSSTAIVRDGAYTKLRLLHQVFKTGWLPNVALPETLLCRPGKKGQRECVGYTMQALPGEALTGFLGKQRSLYEFFDGKAEAFSRYYRSLARTLMELQLLHIRMGDLSCNNVLVDSSGNSYLVDADSFEVGWDGKSRAYGICGGDVTPQYRHPEIGPGAGREQLFQPKHLAFSYAVLMYQSYMNVDANTILHSSQGSRSGDELCCNWRNAPFPLEMEGTVAGHSVSKTVLENWSHLPAALRGVLADVFHNRKTLSLGAWVDFLDSMQEQSAIM